MALVTASGDLRNTVVSCPGKAILLGEYSLSWGRKGLAAAINRRMFAKLEETNSMILQLHLPDIHYFHEWPVVDTLVGQTIELPDTEVNSHFLESLRPLVQRSTSSSAATAAASTFLYFFHGIYRRRRPHGLKISVTSKIPLGAGLGSSAAYSVCLAAGMCLLTGQFNTPECSSCSRPGDKQIPLDVREKLNAATLIGSCCCCCCCPRDDLALVNRWALIGEKIVHGITSGIDNAVCTFGGIISYKREGELSLLTALPGLMVLVVDSRVEHSTRMLGLAVKEKLDRFPKLMNSIFDVAEQACCEMSDMLSCFQDEHEGNHAEISECWIERMGELLDIGHHLVLCMGPVDHPRLQRACSILRGKGMHCKLTGAGGGGSAIALIPPEMMAEDLKSVKDDLEQNDFEVWESPLGCCGVVIHSILMLSAKL